MSTEKSGTTAMPSELIWGEGPKPAVGMIIGEAPGAEEERLGRPFVGASGRLLIEALAAAGANRESFYITNVYKTRPPNNRTPTPKEIGTHANLLWEEYDAINPKYVLLLGKTAAEWHGIKTRHSWEQDREGPTQYLHTWHPSYVLRGKGRDQFFADVREFVNACMQ